jgi:hypothetical protein
LLIVDCSFQSWEVSEYFSHLVTTLTATDVDNAIGVRILGKSLGDTGLAATEGSRNSTGTTLNSWEKCIKYTLSSKKWVVTGELLFDWSWITDRPEM